MANSLHGRARAEVMQAEKAALWDKATEGVQKKKNTELGKQIGIQKGYGMGAEQGYSQGYNQGGQEGFNQGRQQGGQEAIDQTNAMLSQAMIQQQAEPAGGLGIDPRTIQEMGAVQQQAANQMQEDPNMATAMEMLGQLRKAQAANMSSEELQKIYQSIPGNIRVLIADIQEQEEINRSKNRGGNGKLPMTSRTV